MVTSPVIWLDVPTLYTCIRNEAHMRNELIRSCHCVLVISLDVQSWTSPGRKLWGPTYCEAAALTALKAKLRGCVFAWIKDMWERPLRVSVLYIAHSCPCLLPYLKWQQTRRSSSGLPLLPPKKGLVCVGKWHCWGERSPFLTLPLP